MHTTYPLIGSTMPGRGRSAGMSEEIEAHIAAVEAVYRPIIEQARGRLSGGERLWAQFEQAVAAYRRYGRPQVSGIIERVNELAVARQLLVDNSLRSAAIEYEPQILADGHHSR